MAVNQETNNSVAVRPSSFGTSDLISFEFTWTIKNIVRLCRAEIVGQPAIYSPIFIAPPDKITTDDKKPVEFQIRFFPKGYNLENQDFVGMFLDLKNHFGLDIMYIFSVVKANGEKRYESGGLKKFDQTHWSWGAASRAVPRDELYDPANGFVCKGSLTIHCEVNIITSDLVKPDLVDQLQDKYCQPELLAKSYGDLLDSGAHSDVTLVMVDHGGKELRAHKIVLATRSHVFADMFESKMAESVTNRVEIAETRVEVFEQVLHFIYTGRVTSLDAIAKDLLICADKYQLDPLKSICEEYLAASISTESNLSDLLELANLHDAPKLQVKVLDTMRKKVEAQLLDTDKLVLMDSLLSSLAIDNKD